MKNLNTTAGPFKERPYFTNEEIENTCTDELQRVGLYPSKPEPIRIDRFVEKRFGAPHEYGDLPSGLLGYTRFGKKGVSAIVVSVALDDNTIVGERRVRSTLAHEAGHGLLHSYLFALTGQCGLFPEGHAAKPRVLCRDERDTVSAKKYSGEWWEFQANRAIGGLLLPRRLVIASTAEFMMPSGGLGLMGLPRANRIAAAKHVADVFDVNSAVAKIRLDELFPPQQEGQQML